MWVLLPFCLVFEKSYIALLMFNDNLFYISHSAILWSSLFIKYSVSAFVKAPSVLTREVSSAYVNDTGL